MQTKCVHDLCAPLGILSVCLSSCSDSSTYASDKSWLFSSLEKPKYHQFDPHDGIKVAQVLGSLVYICECSCTLTLKEPGFLDPSHSRGGGGGGGFCPPKISETD